MHVRSIYLWSFLVGLNAADLILAVTVWSFNWLSILNVLAVVYGVWEIRRSLKALKQEKAALLTVHNFFVNIHNSEENAKETAAKIARELHYKLGND